MHVRAGRRSASATLLIPRIRPSGGDLLATGWTKVYHPGAAVQHAHDYGPSEFMRRYFDEYRGLRESTGHVEPFGVVATAHYVRAATAGDMRWMAKHGMSWSERGRWAARAAVHHGGRKIFSALGSRAERMPASFSRLAMSLEGRGEGPRQPGAQAGASAADAGDVDAVPRLPPADRIDQMLQRDDYDVIARIWREGARRPWRTRCPAWPTAID